MTTVQLKCMLWEDPNFIQYRIDLSKGVRAYECTLVPAELLGNCVGVMMKFGKIDKNT